MHKAHSSVQTIHPRHKPGAHDDGRRVMPPPRPCRFGNNTRGRTIPLPLIPARRKTGQARLSTCLRALTLLCKLMAARLASNRPRR